MKQDNKQVTDTSNLTKDEAIAAMLKGEKVRHEYFTDNEWAKLNGHFEIEFEDGCKIDVDTFWADRKGSQWQTGWSILPQPTDTGNTVSSERFFADGEKWLQKDQNIFSIRKDGEVLGYIESKNGYLVTTGSIGENTYESFVDLIKGLQGHGIAIDNFYW